MVIMHPNRRLNKDTAYRDHFGYQPSPGRGFETGIYPHESVRRQRQELFNKIAHNRATKKWRSENYELGREGWEGFGNKELPIEKYKKDIMTMVDSNRISLLQGETGSGKSTQLAQYALEMGYDHIVYLEPRRITTDNIADRVEDELREQFLEKNLEMPEHLVGMAHSDRATLKEDSVIQVMTSAVFKRRGPQLQEEWKDKKVLIVADEVHEGNIETEFAVAMSAEMMTEQSNWNMVLMSATMNEEEIQRAYTKINDGPIPSVTVEGRPHDITYNEVPDKTVVDVFEDCEKESAKNPNGTLDKTLIFTEGVRSIRAIESELRRRFPEHRILKLHSKITDEERQEIKRKTDQPTIIISTSAGQSGITIPGVNRVISDGWTKSPELDGENSSGLPPRLCSKAEVTQQMGRGGRDIDGAKFFLAKQLPFGKAGRNEEAEKFFSIDERLDYAPADIYHTSIANNVLSTAAMGRDFYRLNEFLIHSVTHSTIEEAYQVLRLMGAVTEDNKCTKIGKRMDRLPLRPELSRALVEAEQTSTKRQQQRVAAIAAAIEAEGLGDGDPEKIKPNVEKLPSWARDDYFAELAYFNDMMEKFSQANWEENMQLRAGEEQEIPSIRYGYALNNVGIRRTLKQYKKICAALGIDQSSVYESLGDPTSDEIEELKSMFAKGMPHLVYAEQDRRKNRGKRKKGPDGKKLPQTSTITYRNVLGPDVSEQYDYDRTLSNRSVMLLGATALRKEDMIIGFPRWYQDDDAKVHYVVEKSFSMPKEKVQRALGNVALNLQKNTYIGPDGRLRSVETRSIGSLKTGRKAVEAVVKSDRDIDKMVKYALEKPGPAQRELRQLKRYLESFAERIPEKYQPHYFNKKIINGYDIQKYIESAARGVASAGQLDSTLREIMRVDGVTVDSYIDADKIEAIEKTMPKSITIGNTEYELHYKRIDGHEDEILPCISNFSLDSNDLLSNLPEKLQIPDARDILFAYKHSDENNVLQTEYLTAQELRNNINELRELR